MVKYFLNYQIYGAGMVTLSSFLVMIFMVLKWLVYFLL